MKKIIDSIEQVISICGQDFTKWPNNMAPDVLKATYEMLKEYQERLNHHEVDEIFSESDREQILEKVKSFYENKLAEKDRKIDLLLTANKQITYSSKTRQYSQLKKSDFEYYYDCEYCGRLSEGQECEKAYYDNECFRYHDETHILIALKDNSKYKNLEE
ncbi:hypothetical protein SRED_002284 [Spiroplasma melliferum]|uniref:C3H1-type domain-containing protein n=1 Tax=Spiroplasma melliferum TaxID=2134 RepID=A0ABX5UA09_SPIME|nr:hypothetical protein [Spiroplasma melliferum]QCO23426.1 hypothetical protein SRED_001895 [Spiroplasma melliferum]QCO23810.1 hypothetical protein SRED_002284 [Spiroplasma melliferum]